MHSSGEVEKRLGGFRAHNTAPTLDLAHYVGGDFRENRELMDAQVLIGFEGRAYHVRDFYASQLLSMVLGGGMSSRLFQEVREKRGLCYSVYAFHWGFSDTGLFGIHAATGRDELVELVPVLIDELHKAADSISLEEVDRAPRAISCEPSHVAGKCCKPCRTGRTPVPALWSSRRKQ